MLDEVEKQVEELAVKGNGLALLGEDDETTEISLQIAEWFTKTVVNLMAQELKKLTAMLLLMRQDEMKINPRFPHITKMNLSFHRIYRSGIDRAC